MSAQGGSCKHRAQSRFKAAMEALSFSNHSAHCGGSGLKSSCLLCPFIVSTCGQSTHTEITSHKKDTLVCYRDTKGQCGPEDRSHTASGYKKTSVMYIAASQCWLLVMDLSNYVVWKLTAKNLIFGPRRTPPCWVIFSKLLPLSGSQCPHLLKGRSD